MLIIESLIFSFTGETVAIAINFFRVPLTKFLPKPPQHSEVLMA